MIKNSLRKIYTNNAISPLINLLGFPWKGKGAILMYHRVVKDEEIEEDRGDWIKRYSDYRVDDKYNYDASIHTIAIEIEQVRRDGKIYYDIPKKNVRLD